MTIFLGKVSIRFDFPDDLQKSAPCDVKEPAFTDASTSSLYAKTEERADEDKPAFNDSADICGSSISSDAHVGKHAGFSVDTDEGDTCNRTNTIANDATMAYDGGAAAGMLAIGPETAHSARCRGRGPCVSRRSGGSGPR